MNSHNQPDPNAFILCFLVGTAGIILLKWLDVNQFVVTACPVLVMLGYAIRHHKSQYRYAYLLVGDNLYYLGLLYTLVSLAVSLVEFAPKDENIESITLIITNFGIAIFSTIFGVTLRVYFSLMHTSPEKMEQIAHSELEHAVYNFCDQLREATRDFSIFRLEMQQMIRDGLNETKEALDKDLQHGLSQFKTAVTHFAETVQMADKNFAENQQKLQDGFEETLKEISTAIKNFIATVQMADKDFAENQQKLQDGFKETKKEISTAVTDFVATLQVANKGFDEGQQKLQDSSSSVSESVNKLAMRIDKIQIPEDLLERILQPSIQRIEKGTEQVGDAGEALVNRLNNVQIPTDELARRLQQSIERFLSEIEQDFRVQFNKSSQEFETVLTEFFQAIKMAGEGFESEGQEIRDSLNTLVTSIKELSKRIDDIPSKGFFSRWRLKLSKGFFSRWRLKLSKGFFSRWRQK